MFVMYVYLLRTIRSPLRQASGRVNRLISSLVTTWGGLALERVGVEVAGSVSDNLREPQRSPDACGRGFPRDV